MSSMDKTAEKVLKLAIKGEMTIFQAGEQKQAILNMVSLVPEVEVDLSQVTEIDAAGLQLLMSAKLEAWQQSKVIRFVGHSAAITEAIDLCGLSTFFGDPIIISSKAS